MHPVSAHHAHDDGVEHLLKLPGLGTDLAHRLELFFHRSAWRPVVGLFKPRGRALPRGPAPPGARHDGGPAFKGPAEYANVIIDPHASAGLPAVLVTSVEPGTIVAWRAAAPSAYDRNGIVMAKDAPVGEAGTQSRSSRLASSTSAARLAWRALRHHPLPGSRLRFPPRHLCAGPCRSALPRRCGCS